MLGQADRIGPQFDAAYYRREYPDIDLPPELLAGHFSEFGWREGRNPGAGFDTVAYLEAHPDLAAAGHNPFAAHLDASAAPGAEPALGPSVASLGLFGYLVLDWVERLRPHVDLAFYTAALGPALDLLEGVDLVAHFAFRGWRHGLSPHAGFDTQTWLAAHPEVARAGVNPLLAFLEGIGSGEAPREASADPTDPAILVARAFSPAFYRRTNPDYAALEAAAGLDPLEHYLTIGWRQGHRPNATFDTTYYLRANPDVAEAGVEPFTHFLVEGRREGRIPSPPGGYRRRVVDAARPPALPAPSSLEPADGGDWAWLREQLTVLGGGLVVALSHDRYTISVGGTQILIADEQRKFAAAGWAYLHLAPVRPALRMVEDDGFELWATLDGRPAGRVRAEHLAMGLMHAAPRGTVFVVHSLLGFDADAVLLLAACLSPERAFFWLHDYASLCPGFNLLRNDVTFCHAPPPDSLACRICAYGGMRPAQSALFARILSAIDFTVVAPSEAAAAVWQAGAGAAAPPLVHPHWRLRRVKRAASATPRLRASRFAFLGHPYASKGWPGFQTLVDRLADRDGITFLHLAAADPAPIPGVRFVPTRVTAGDRRAAVDRLREAGVDVVLVLSPWPETFSFAAHEAIVAGCLVFCLEASGNVAAVVRETGQGLVFADEAALAEAIAAGIADRMLADLDCADTVLEIEESGTTATLVLTPALAPGG